MAIPNIFQVPVKETISSTLQGRTFALIGKSKTGKTTICAQASKGRGVLLQTEDGAKDLTGFVPIPIATWQDFRSAVNQLCTDKGREQFDVVAVDTLTNLMILLDKWVGQKMSNEKVQYDFATEATYGAGAKLIKPELALQLQKLTNKGYTVFMTVHAEDKTDFNTQKNYTGLSLTNSLYGVVEKAVDQIIYLKKEPAKDKNSGDEYWTYFTTPRNETCSFVVGGRLTPRVERVPTNYEEISKALLEAIDDKAKAEGASLTPELQNIIIAEPEYDFVSLMKEFDEMTKEIVEKNEADALVIKTIIEKIAGPGKKVSQFNSGQVELLNEILEELKKTFKSVNG